MVITAPFAALNTMEFVYEQSTGTFRLEDSQGRSAVLGGGYSGKGSAINEPDTEHLVGTGPIPRGRWRLFPAIDHPRLGPVSIPLAFGEGKSAASKGPYGRSAFYIHGDGPKPDFTASAGCIILPRQLRDFICLAYRSGVRHLMVV